MRAIAPEGWVPGPNPGWNRAPTPPKLGPHFPLRSRILKNYPELPVLCFEGAALQVAAAKHIYCHNTPASSAVAQTLVEQAKTSIATDLTRLQKTRKKVVCESFHRIPDLRNTCQNPYVPRITEHRRGWSRSRTIDFHIGMAVRTLPPRPGPYMSRRSLPDISPGGPSLVPPKRNL